MTSGVRRTVKAIRSTSPADKRSRRPGPLRAYEEMSSSGSPRRLTGGRGMPQIPALLVGREQRLDVISQSAAYPQHGLDVIPARRDALTSIQGPCHLVEVPTDGCELGHYAVERKPVLLEQRRDSPQVRPYQRGDIRGGGNTARRRPLLQEQPIIGVQAHVQSDLAV